jgi:hypothetical protein
MAERKFFEKFKSTLGTLERGDGCIALVQKRK